LAHVFSDYVVFYNTVDWDKLGAGASWCGLSDMLDIRGVLTLSGPGHVLGRTFTFPRVML